MTNKSRAAQLKQERYRHALLSSTYMLCCHTHKDMMHAELCPIAKAEREVITREILVIDSQPMSALAEIRESNRALDTDRWFAIGVPCWMRVEDHIGTHQEGCVMQTIKQLYRYDHVVKGEATLTVESYPQGGVIEVKRDSARNLYKYRQLHYPNAHNYRHHMLGEDGCPTCDMTMAT